MIISSCLLKRQFFRFQLQIFSRSSFCHLGAYREEFFDAFFMSWGMVWHVELFFCLKLNVRCESYVQLGSALFLASVFHIWCENYRKLVEGLEQRVIACRGWSARTSWTFTRMKIYIFNFFFFITQHCSLMSCDFTAYIYFPVFVY